MPVLTSSAAAGKSGLLGFGSDYAVYRPVTDVIHSGQATSVDALTSWAAAAAKGGGVTSYTNAGFYQSSSDNSPLGNGGAHKNTNNNGTIDSGFYRAGEIVDNMAEFFVQPNSNDEDGVNVADYLSSYRGNNLTSPYSGRVNWADNSDPSSRTYDASMFVVGVGGEANNYSSHKLSADDHHSLVMSHQHPHMRHLHHLSSHHHHHHGHHHSHHEHDMMMMILPNGGVGGVDGGGGGRGGEEATSDNATSSTDCDHSSEACSDKNDPPASNANSTSIMCTVSATPTAPLQQMSSSSSSSMSSSTARGYQRLPGNNTPTTPSINNNNSRLSTSVTSKVVDNGGRSSSEITDDDSSGTSGSRNAAAEFHSLIVTSSGVGSGGGGGSSLIDPTWIGLMSSSSINVVGDRQSSDEAAKLSVLSAGGPLSLPHSYELDIQERRRRRESFV